MKQTSLALLLATCQQQYRSFFMHEQEFIDELPQLKKLLRETVHKTITSFRVDVKRSELLMVTTDGKNYLLTKIWTNDEGWTAYDLTAGDAQDIIDWLLNF